MPRSEMYQLLAIAIAVILALGTLLAKWWIDSRMTREKNAFDLHREMNSKEMLDARNAAWEFIRKHPDKSIAMLYAWQDDSAGLRPVWQVLHFFQRVSICWNKHHIERSLVFELFGDLFTWWNYIFERMGLNQVEWQAKYAMHDMKRFFEQEAERDDRVKDVLCRWRKLAKEDADRCRLREVPGGACATMSTAEGTTSAVR